MAINFKSMRLSWEFVGIALTLWCILKYVSEGDFSTIPLMILMTQNIIFFSAKLLMTQKWQIKTTCWTKTMKNNIKTIRKDLQLRQEDVAAMVGVTRQTIIAIENDRYNPSLGLAMKLAKLLNTPMEVLFQLE